MRMMHVIITHRSPLLMNRNDVGLVRQGRDLPRRQGCLLPCSSWISTTHTSETDGIVARQVSPLAYGANVNGVGLTGFRTETSEAVGRVGLWADGDLFQLCLVTECLYLRRGLGLEREGETRRRQLLPAHLADGYV